MVNYPLQSKGIEKKKQKNLKTRIRETEKKKKERNIRI